MTVDRKRLHETDVLLNNIVISVYYCIKLSIIKNILQLIDAFISKGFRLGYKGYPLLKGRKKFRPQS